MDSGKNSAGKISAAAVLLGLCLLVSVLARVPLDYLAAAAQQLHAPANYVHEVLPSSQAQP